MWSEITEDISFDFTEENVEAIEKIITDNLRLNGSSELSSDIGENLLSGAYFQKKYKSISYSYYNNDIDEEYSNNVFGLIDQYLFKISESAVQYEYYQNSDDVSKAISDIIDEYESESKIDSEWLDDFQKLYSIPKDRMRYLQFFSKSERHFSDLNDETDETLVKLWDDITSKEDEESWNDNYHFNRAILFEYTSYKAILEFCKIANWIENDNEYPFDTEAYVELCLTNTDKHHESYRIIDRKTFAKEYEVNFGDLFVIESIDEDSKDLFNKFGKDSYEKFESIYELFDSGEILKLDEDIFSHTLNNRWNNELGVKQMNLGYNVFFVSEKSPKGAYVTGRYQTNFVKTRKATQEEIAHYERVGQGANIKDL